MEHSWVTLSDDDLLKLRICDLHVRIEGSELEPRIAELHAELDARELPLKPACYLSDEWFSPEGSPMIAIPFYLAHWRLKALELHLMLEVEGGTPDWCRQLLRHECGHAYDHGYLFSSQERWAEVFGNPEADYMPETYRPRPYSKSFVRHLPNWYAQAHPHEDFAETFAVWLELTPEQWRAQYRAWKALDKLEFVEELMREPRQVPPKVLKERRVWDASRSTRTLAKYYASKRKMYAEDFPDVYDADLRAIFGNPENADGTAASLMRRLRRPLIASVVRWTGQRKYTVDLLISNLIARARDLELPASRDEEKTLIDLSAYLSALVTNHLHTGRFKRSV